MYFAHFCVTSDSFFSLSLLTDWLLLLLYFAAFRVVIVVSDLCVINDVLVLRLRFLVRFFSSDYGFGISRMNVGE